MELFTRIAICSSSLMSCKAPISFHVTSGMVAKPSRLADGWMCFSASCSERINQFISHIPLALSNDSQLRKSGGFKGFNKLNINSIGSTFHQSKD